MKSGKIDVKLKMWEVDGVELATASIDGWHSGIPKSPADLMRSIMKHIDKIGYPKAKMPREWLMDAVCPGCGYDFGDLRDNAGHSIGFTVECKKCGEFTEVDMKWR